MTIMSIALDVVILLAAGLAATAALRRRSAALRHSVLASVIVVATLVPLLELFVPQWSLPVAGSWNAPGYITSGLRLTSDSSELPLEASSTLTAASAVDRDVRLPTLLIVWAGGALLWSAIVAVGFIHLMLIASRAVRLESGPWATAVDDLARAYGLRSPVAILQSSSPSLLVTWGHWRPRIILPAGASAWPAERIRVVVAHELAHIRRGDWLIQLCAETLCAVHWFNPLTWLACRRLRRESEYACDDAVLARGIGATAYASHLLDIARQFAQSRRAWSPAPAIAHASTLERRISAMFNESRDRRPPTLRTSLLVMGALVTIAVPLTALGVSTPLPEPTPTPRMDIALLAPTVAEPPAKRPNLARATAVAAPQPRVSAVTGTLYDQLGGLLPGVAVRLTDAVSGAEYNTTTERDATFAFENLTPGQYQLRATLPGFRPVTTAFSLAAGERLLRVITLPIGSLQETVTVTCGPGAGATAPSIPSTAPVTSGRGAPPVPPASTGRGSVAAAGTGVPFSGGIGGQIAVPRRITSVAPRCPFALTTAAVVILGGRIGIDGHVNDIKVLRTGPPEIVEAAVTAVQQWVFTPTLLNNTPVDVEIAVTVSFGP